LNDLQVKVSDIENAYITAPCTEKIWTVLGPEFGSDAGKTTIDVRALYDLKSAGASFRNHLADCMTRLGFTPCLADPDLYGCEQKYVLATALNVTRTCCYMSTMFWSSITMQRTFCFALINISR